MRKVHLDLFSGIGGFALAVDEVWPGSEHFFCELDPYCQALLKKRFEGSRIYGDIRELTGGQAEQELKTAGDKQWGRGATSNTELKGQQELKRPYNPSDGTKVETRVDYRFERQNCIDLLTGGFPCQPFSQAGKRKGTDDNRFLWPEMLRVIRSFKPTWVIAENVRGLLTINEGMVFEQVCLDLEREGYEVQPFIIPAVAVNAPHRRDRVWFVANRTGARQSEEGGQVRPHNGEVLPKDGERLRNVPDTKDSDAPDTELSRRTHRVSGQEREERARECRNDIKKFDRTEWERNWLEVALETCSGVRGIYDGLSERIHGFTPARHRVERLKALGNAIVPQVAVEIMRAIKEAEETWLT